MSGGPAIISVDDDDGTLPTPASPGGGAAPFPPPDPNISGQSDHLPVEPRQRHDRAPREVFEIVETDSDFNPVGDGKPPQPYVDPGEQVRPDDAVQPEEGDGRYGHRLSRRERRQLQRQGRETSEAEKQFLRAKVEELERRLNGFQPRIEQFDHARRQQFVQGLETKIQAAADKASIARRELATAITEGDSERISKALDERDAAVIAGQQAIAEKRLFESGAQIPGFSPAAEPSAPAAAQPAAPPSPPPGAQPHINEFLREFPSFGNQDSRASRAFTLAVANIDNEVANEGYRPDTAEYWDEVRNRMDEIGLVDPADDGGRAAPRQPDRRPQQQAQPPQSQARRGPPVAGAGTRTPGAPQQVRLSPERKAALIASGSLSQDGRTVIDRAKFDRQLRGYVDFDRANRTTGA